MKADCSASERQTILDTKPAVAASQAVEGRSALRLLELGCNRIRELSGLSGLPSLEQLWLGRNRVDRIANLDGCALFASRTQLPMQGLRCRSHGSVILANGVTALFALSHFMWNLQR